MIKIHTEIRADVPTNDLKKALKKMLRSALDEVDAIPDDQRAMPEDTTTLILLKTKIGSGGSYVTIEAAN